MNEFDELVSNELAILDRICKIITGKPRTDLGWAVSRLRKLLVIHKPGSEPLPDPPEAKHTPQQWKKAEGPNGEYEFLDARKDPELTARVMKAPMTKDGMYYWWSETVNVVMRKEAKPRRRYT